MTYLTGNQVWGRLAVKTKYEIQKKTNNSRGGAV